MLFLSKLDSVKGAVESIKKGKMIIVVDDEKRENEGDFVVAAEKITVPQLNFIGSFGRGLICVPVTNQKAKQLDLPLMATEGCPYGTAFTVSVDAKKAGTGISMPNRLKTIRLLADGKSSSEDFFKPGHVFPLISRDGGVLERAGHTEASIDIMKLAGLKPAAVICEILKENGKMARLPDLLKMKKKWKMKIVSVHDIIAYRLKTEGKQVVRIASPEIFTEFGKFAAIAYRALPTNDEYIAFVKGKVKGKENVLVRVHSACLTGDVFHSLHCDCRQQLEKSLRMISKAKCGVLLYIPHHEGRGIGISNKLKAYELQAKGKDTMEANLLLGFPADKRDYGVGAQILADLGLRTIVVLTNNPKKLVGLNAFGLEITKRIPLETKPNNHNKKYLKTKKEKMGHLL